MSIIFDAAHAVRWKGEEADSAIQVYEKITKETTMEFSEKASLALAIEIIKSFEGCRLRAYKCPAGVWTIGYGETQGVREGDVWTQEQAEVILQRRVLQFMNDTLAKCPRLLAEPPNRLAACTSLAYNIGIGAFAKSSVCKFTGSCEYDRAADAFLLWNKAGGKVLFGLTRRREAERKLYLSTG